MAYRSISRIRSSNFELLRIVAMLMVMVIHATAYGPVGLPTVADGVANPGLTFLRCLTHGLVIVCVNVFVLLSGYFGIRLKARSVCSYLFQTAFWRVLSLVVVCVAYGVGVSGIKLSSLIPFAAMTIKPLGFTFGAWFIGAYLGLMLFAPVLNAFIEKTDTRRLGLFVGGFFVLEILFDWLIGGLTYFCGGFSLVPLMGLYLCGAWLRRDDCLLSKLSLKTYAGVYLGIAVASALAMFLALVIGRKIPLIAGVASNLFFPFSSLHAIVGSVAFFLMFSKFDFKSRFVNWIAESAFAAYLFHGAMPFYKAISLNIFTNCGRGGYLLQISALIAGVFLCAVVIDKVRIYLWHRIVEKANNLARFRGLKRGFTSP